MLYNIKRKYMIMSVLWNNYKQRYKDMGNLPLVLVVVIICIVVYSFPMIITHMIAGGNKLFLGGVYLCDLLALIVLCVNIIRIDCRNLLSRKTARLLEYTGYSTLLLMIVRDQLARKVSGLVNETLYSMDWATIMVFGMILVFVGRIVRRAIKIKEENDLTI